MSAPVPKSVLHLAEVLDPTAAGPLLQSLLSFSRGELAVDASAVTRTSTPCLQVLLAAANSFAADGRAFAVINPSPAFAEAVSLLGLMPGQLPMGSPAP
jgi:chemotaxis protein CheX